MKEKNVTVYICDYCKKKLFRKGAMGLHEERCYKNPANDRLCYNCEHLESRNIGTCVEGEDGSYYTRKVNVMACQKFNTCLYPPLVVHKGTEPYEFEYLDNLPMPATCAGYQPCAIINCESMLLD